MDVVEQNLSSQVQILEEQRNSFRKKCQELENHIVNQDNIITNLKLNLKYEKFKNYVLSQLITIHSQIKPEELFKENNEEISIHNFENGNIPVIVHDYFGTETKQYNISGNKKKTIPSGKNFRTVKNKVNLVEEKPEEQEEKIKQVEKDLEELEQKHFDISIKEVYDSIEISFDEIVKNRVYKKSLDNIKNNRSKLLGKLDIDEYTKLIKTHITRLENIFANKKYDTKKTLSSIDLSLSALDKRLIFYNGYFNSSLDIDDIERFKNAIVVNMEYPKRYIPYSQQDLFPKFCDYSMAIFTIQDILNRLLVNPYGFPNIVYLHEKDEDCETDPFRFYYLEKIENSKRLWIMDCRLDNFSKSLSIFLLNYCVKLFRRIYFDIFNDNFYREDYREKASIAKEDCEQLLSNILIIARPRKLCDIIRIIIFKKCTIQPSQIDKFNFRADDRLNKKQFSQKENIEEEIRNIFNQIFDGISSQDLEKIVQEKLISLEEDSNEF